MQVGIERRIVRGSGTGASPRIELRRKEHRQKWGLSGQAAGHIHVSQGQR